MFTKTAKSVIAPLAEAVSSLVLIISEAEISRAPMPDLSALARVVDDQISHLTGVGLRISQQANVSDTQLKQDMPESCDLVKQSSELLVSATASLAKDPHSSLGRNNLLEGVKGILRNTAKILSVMDDLEDQEKAFDDAVSPAAVDKWESLWVQTVGQYSQTFIAFTQLLTKRAVELIDQNLQARLQSAIQLLTRESPLLISSCQVVVARVGPAQGKAMLAISCNRIISSLDEVEAIIKTRLDEEFNFDQSARQEITKNEQIATQNMEDLINEVKYVLGTRVGNPQTVLNDLATLSTNTISGTKRLLNLITDPIQRSALQGQLETVQKADAETIAAIKIYLSRPDSIQTQQDLGQKLAQTRNAHNLLKFMKNRMIVSELSTSNMSLLDSKSPTTVLGSVFDAATKGNRPKLTNTLQVLEGEVARWGSLCTSGMELCPFPDKQSAIDSRNCVRTAQALLPMITASANMLSTNPTDPTSVQHLERIGKTWSENLQSGIALARNNFTQFEIISGVHHCFGQHADGLAKALAVGNSDGIATETLATLASAHQFSAAAKRVCESAADPAYRSSLESRYQEMDRLIPQFTIRAKQLLESKKPHEAGELMNCIKELSARFLAIEDVMRVRNESLINLSSMGDVVNEEEKELAIEGISVQILETAMDTCVIDDEPPRLMPEAEAKLDPILAAAQEIRVEAANWSPKENPIIESSSKISDHLSSLAKFHKLLAKEYGNAEAKKGFITAAKNIYTESLKISTAAKPIADRCLDAHLQKQLNGSLLWIENLSQQLKIVAAVKTSAPADTDKDQQLIACARNIMSAVKNCIRDSEACSMRMASDVQQPKDFGKKDVVPVVPAVKFRRNVYRRTGVLR
ncbi:Vinculin/alpha-catenin [Obelidium mucronatum]|nr:Vinculin/alpha-catenin [Obelidium mucronatum]